ncbi:MAG: sulfite exporter TauE/SafE family protein [Promethearchaeota archaeon]
MQQIVFLQEYWIIFIPAFLLGLLHTAMPCEDKAIFCFWSFGITKEPKNSLFTLIIYGLGLMTANSIISFIIVLISLIPLIIFPEMVSDPHIVTFFGAFSSMVVAIIFLVFITQKDYLPHSRLKDKIVNWDWAKKRTPYLFGIIMGFPPCIFELYIYSQCLIFTISYGVMQGVLTVFFFSIGTFIGLFPLALAKQGISDKAKEVKKNKNTIYIIMFLIIIIVNFIIMIFSLSRIHIFPV